MKAKCAKCGGDDFLWQRDSAIEFARVVGFDSEGTPIIDDSSWETSDAGGGNTWVSCRSCGATLLSDVSYVISQDAEDSDHPEHVDCADGCGLAVTHSGPCLNKPGGHVVCSEQNHVEQDEDATA